MQDQDKKFLLEAIGQAKESIKQGGFPAGTIIVRGGKIISRGISIGNILHDPTSHGEVNAIREACKNIKSGDLKGATIYSSLEPCLMCLSASMWANVSKIVYACGKSKVSAEYYGGNYQSSDINNTFLKKIEIVQMKDLEDTSFEIISEWEKNLPK
jgi:guanine deaminase